MESSNDSRFYGAIASLVNLANVDSCYLYGEKEEKGIDKESFNTLLNKRDIKWSAESNIKSMIGSMIEHINNKGYDICLLVTDGILSGSNEDIENNRSYNISQKEALSLNIAALFEKESDKMSALIIRYEAKFNTSKTIKKGGWYYYCYNNDQKIINNQDRPFFIIVVGRWKCIKYLEGELNKAIAESMLSESNFPKLSTPTDMALFGENFGIYDNIELKFGNGISRSGTKLKIEQSYYDRDSLIRFTADISELPSYMRDPNYMKENVELSVKKQGESNVRTLADKDYQLQIKEKNEKTVLKLSIKARKLRNSQLVFKMNYSEPKWIADNSDDNDLDILENPSVKMGKTFNFWYLAHGFSALQKNKTIKEQTLEFE